MPLKLRRYLALVKTLQRGANASERSPPRSRTR
jgi:hypothetical protein